MELKTIDDAVDHIISLLSLKEKFSIANLPEKKLSYLKSGIIAYVQENLDTCGITQTLVKDCASITGEDTDMASASSMIVDSVWKKLQETNKLRIVK